MSHDYSEYLKPESAAVVDLSQLQDLAEKQQLAAAKIEGLEQQLDEAKREYKDLAERQVPEMMDQIQLSEFKTSSGLIIKVDEVIRAGIPKERSREAFLWLKEHNHEALMKRSITVEFGKGEASAAAELSTVIGSLGYSAKDETKVHPQTLTAWVKEKLKDGQDIPLDLFGVFRQRVAKIKT